MSISKFEKICLKYQTPIDLLVVFIVGIVSSLIRSSTPSSKAINVALLVVAFLVLEFMSLTQFRIRKRANKIYSDELNPNAAISLMEELLTSWRCFEMYEKMYIYNDLFGYYISTGKYENVIDTYTKIKREKKKIERSYDLQLRLFLSTAYLLRGEKDLYDKELALIREQMGKTKITKRVTAHQFTEIRLLEESLYGGNDPKFEAKVFDFLYEKNSNGKDKNPKPTNMQMISAYGLLFNYYKLNGDNKNATEYANKIVDMGNEQLAVYRNAKEYLSVKAEG